MEVLGFINVFDELVDADARLGRKVANQGMVAALLEHGSCDELHFFLPFLGRSSRSRMIMASGWSGGTTGSG